MSSKKIRGENNLNERIENLDKTLKVRKTVLDKILNKLKAKEKFKGEE